MSYKHLLGKHFYKTRVATRAGLYCALLIVRVCHGSAGRAECHTEPRILNDGRLVVSWFRAEYLLFVCVCANISSIIFVCARATTMLFSGHMLPYTVSWLEVPMPISLCVVYLRVYIIIIMAACLTFTGSSCA